MRGALNKNCNACTYWNPQARHTFKCHTDKCPAKIRDSKKNLKIFEVREYQDGGWMDRGRLIGFVKATSKVEARKTCNIITGHQQVTEISEVEFNNRKREAYRQYKLFKY